MVTWVTATRSDELDSEEAAFRRFYESYAGRIRALARKLLADDHMVEDVLQETLLRAYHAELHLEIEDPAANSSRWAWLATVTRNLVVDHVRRQRELLAEDPANVVVSKASPLDEPETRVSAAQYREGIREALAAFTQRQRRVLILRDLEGRPYKEIAAMEGMSLPAVKTTLLRTRQVFRERYESIAEQRGLRVLVGGGIMTRLLGRARELRDRVVVGFTDGWAGAFAGTPGTLHGLAAGVVVGALLLPSLPSSQGSETRPGRAPGAPQSDSLGSVPESAALSGPARPVSHVRDVPPTSGEGQAVAQWTTASPQPTEPAPQEPSDDGPLSPVTDVAEPPVRSEDTPVHEDEPEEPEDASIIAFSSPTQSSGGSADSPSSSTSSSESQHVFALGHNRGRCGTSSCLILFHSDDGGGTWAPLPTEIPSGTPTDAASGLLVTPGYPDDPRIYIVGAGYTGGLLVSTDGGRTFGFAPGSTKGSPSVMSSRFSDGDERILGGGPPGWVYDAARQTSSPFAGAPLTEPGQIRFAFTPRDDAQPTLFVGSSIPEIRTRPGHLRRYSALYRCEGETCEGPITFGPHVNSAPNVVVSPRYASDGVVLVHETDYLFRSTDGGRTFTEVVWPVDGRVVTARQIVADPAGVFYATIRTGDRGGLLVSTDGGVTWQERGNRSIFPERPPVTIATLGRPGHLLTSRTGGGLLCSTDGGHTWASRCGQ